MYSVLSSYSFQAAGCAVGLGLLLWSKALRAAVIFAVLAVLVFVLTHLL